MSLDAKKIVVDQIHNFCKKMTPDEKRDALKKASLYLNPHTNKTSYIDNINHLSINGYIPSIARLKITLKNLNKRIDK